MKPPVDVSKLRVGCVVRSTCPLEVDGTDVLAGMVGVVFVAGETPRVRWVIATTDGRLITPAGNVKQGDVELEKRERRRT